MSLTPSLPQAQWLDRFATCLGKLIKGIDAESAYGFAKVTFHDAADFMPEEAASIFADELPPGEFRDSEF